MDGIDSMVSDGRGQQRQQVAHTEQAQAHPFHRANDSTAATSIGRSAYQIVATVDCSARAQTGGGMAALNSYPTIATNTRGQRRHAFSYELPGRHRRMSRGEARKEITFVPGVSDKASVKARKKESIEKLMARRCKEDGLAAEAKRTRSASLDFARLHKLEDAATDLSWRRKMERESARQASPSPETPEAEESEDEVVTLSRSSSVRTVYHISEELPASARR